MSIDEPKPQVTYAMLVDELGSLGLAHGDSVIVHSSLSRFGHVEGGADTVVDALLAAVGDAGTVAVPTSPVTWRGGSHYHYIKHNPLLDLRVTPSKLGAITNALRVRPEARPSLSACHTLHAIGGRRDWLLAGAETAVYPTGPGTPWHRNCIGGGKVLLIGIGQNSNTTIHTIEEAGGAPILSKEVFYPMVIDLDGCILTVPTRAHLPNHPRAFEKMDAVCLEHDIMSVAKVGNATLRLIEAKPFLEIGVRLLERDPLYLLA
jgi:aminoglycoside 3-N-acetyltransferase